MPQQNEDGQTEPQVRRAVTMRGAASQPASASLRPRTAADPNPGQAEEPSSAAPSSSDSASSERGGDQPTAAAAPSSSVSEARSSERSATTSSGADATTSSGADAGSSEGSASSGAGADGSAGGAVGSLSRAEGGTPPGASQGNAGAGGDVPPSGRPTKALLAAAGIGGALLIAAPFLVMGARDDDKTDTAAVAKDATARTLQKDEEETRPGDYAPKPPEVENKAPKSEALKKEEGTPSDEEEGTPSDEKEKGTPSDEPSPDASPSGEPSSDASPSDESSSESSDAEESSSKSSPSDEPVAKSTVPEAHFLKPRLFLAPEPPPSEPQPQESTPPKEHPGTEPSTAPPEKQEKAKEGSGIKKKVAPPNYANAKGVLLKNVASKLCADVPAFGKGKPDGPVNQFHCNGTDKDNQIWDFEVKEKGKGPRSTDLFQIRNRKDGLCMDLPKFGGQPRGTRVSEFHCNGTTADNQLWWLEPRGDKKFRIHNYASNHQCLKMKTGKDIHPVDARLEIQPCHREGPFEWTF
ncbi:RICIN domain-containing protein [Streptomyces tubbatahanensis]|uniref:RICIN domain-containing protein n=1 Tax=Streptomyces tubbatahanensis TaxID=2923272 RepID=A0ABY3XYX6_9ACTN|nr:RICIN domain-containing protein [Streptomyces tubbatahanensis]UNS99677.1 RICIN domain-containing protein [Streptomyces tubbatahanensis]